MCSFRCSHYSMFELRCASFIPSFVWGVLVIQHARSYTQVDVYFINVQSLQQCATATLSETSSVR